jgi:hypothetical protein
MTEKSWTLALWAVGLVYGALGTWAAVAPASFTRELADFGTYNRHLIHDVATVLLTLGIALVAAAYLPRWRTPVLALAALWNGLHAVSHVVDLDKASTPQMGIGVAVMAIIPALGFAWLARRSAKASA